MHRTESEIVVSETNGPWRGCKLGATESGVGILWPHVFIGPVFVDGCLDPARSPNSSAVVPTKSPAETPIPTSRKRGSNSCLAGNAVRALTIAYSAPYGEGF